MSGDEEGGIAVIDSGAGGLPYLSACRRHLAASRFIYFADTKHYPYGEKSADQIIDHVTIVVERLIKEYSPTAFVVACNTASVVALESLRQRFSTPFVGVVPAVKKAAEVSTNRRIGLLATNRTVLDRYTDELILQFAEECHVERVSDEEIVNFVEHQILESDVESRMRAIESAVSRFVSTSIDTLVLGCTHFVFVANEFRSRMPDLRVVDSREGVARQLARVAPDSHAHLRSSAMPGVLHVSQAGSHEERYRGFADRFALTYEGQL